MAIEDQYFEYLKTVNPIAQKIAEDIEKIRESHKESWNSLDVKSKERLVDDALIDLNLIQKYECKEDQDLEEHFGPLSTFSWFTRSQLNLFTHINVKPDKARTPLRKSEILSPLKKTKNAPIVKGPEISNKTHKSKAIKDEKKGVAKPKTPPPPPPAKLVPAEKKGLLEDSHGDDIPKTGFDFLDNW